MMVITANDYQDNQNNNNNDGDYNDNEYESDSNDAILAVKILMSTTIMAVIIKLIVIIIMISSTGKNDNYTMRYQSLFCLVCISFICFKIICYSSLGIWWIGICFYVASVWEGYIFVQLHTWSIYFEIRLCLVSYVSYQQDQMPVSKEKNVL